MFLSILIKNLLNFYFLFWIRNGFTWFNNKTNTIKHLLLPSHPFLTFSLISSRKHFYSFNECLVMLISADANTNIYSSSVLFPFIPQSCYFLCRAVNTCFSQQYILECGLVPWLCLYSFGPPLSLHTFGKLDLICDRNCSWFNFA